MKTGVLMTLALFCVPVGLQAQQADSSILLLSGASSMEELESSEVERFEKFLVRPLDLNAATRGELLSSGLLSNYQVASILDYKERNGDILSFTELALVDGFGRTFVEALRNFVKLESGSKPGEIPKKPESHLDFQAKASNTGNNGAKLKYSLGEYVNVNIAWRDVPSGSISLTGRKHRAKLIIGDFNARFGQGLALWSGFSLSGFSSITSFSKHGSGLAPAWTYSPSSALRGLALNWEHKNSSISALTYKTKTGINAAANIGHYWSHCQLSATAMFDAAGEYKISNEGRLGIGKLDVFAETCLTYSIHEVPRTSIDAICGGIFNKSYDVKFAAVGKLGQDQAGCAFGMQAKNHFTSVDITQKQIKLLETSIVRFSPEYSLASRLACRYKPSDKHPWRLDARIDLKWTAGQWSFTWRSNALYCSDFAHLHYAETGFKDEKKGFYLRLTGFSIANWDDRIYVYERDAPGNFSVPAYYGKGFDASIYAFAKVWHSKFYLRAEYMNSSRHKNKITLKGSYAISF